MLGDSRMAAIKMMAVTAGCRITLDAPRELDLARLAAQRAGRPALVRVRVRPGLPELRHVASDFSESGVSIAEVARRYKAGIPLNEPAWSDTADSTGFPFGARPPAWTSTAPGVVLLQGAARQAFPSAPNPNLLGTVPPAARPTRVVYTIAHTNDGTYVDLSIDTDGSINLIGPRPPAVQDYSFVSLESTSYQQ